MGNLNFLNFTASAIEKCSVLKLVLNKLIYLYVFVCLRFFEFNALLLFESVCVMAKITY